MKTQLFRRKTCFLSIKIVFFSYDLPLEGVFSYVPAWSHTLSGLNTCDFFILGVPKTKFFLKNFLISDFRVKLCEKSIAILTNKNDMLNLKNRAKMVRKPHFYSYFQFLRIKI